MNWNTTLLRFFFYIIIFLLAEPASIFSQNPSSREKGKKESGSLDWKEYSDGVKEAGAKKKKILIDVYTDWCGWCKKMDKDVYADAKVKDYLAANFVIIKLNAESKRNHDVRGQTYSEKEIAAGLGATSFPTTVFLDPQNDPITSIPGYIKADMFLNVLEFIHGDHYKTKSWNDFLVSRQKK